MGLVARSIVGVGWGILRARAFGLLYPGGGGLVITWISTGSSPTVRCCLPCPTRSARSSPIHDAWSVIAGRRCPARRDHGRELDDAATYTTTAAPRQRSTKSSTGRAGAGQSDQPTTSPRAKPLNCTRADGQQEFQVAADVVMPQDLVRPPTKARPGTPGLNWPPAGAIRLDPTPPRRTGTRRLAPGFPPAHGPSRSDLRRWPMAPPVDSRCSDWFRCRSVTAASARSNLAWPRRAAGHRRTAWTLRAARGGPAAVSS